MTGIRAEIQIDRPSQCLVAAVSEAVGTQVESVSRADCATDSDGTIEEFVLEAGNSSDAAASDINADLETVFTYESKQAYRFERPTERSCPCDYIESIGNPLLDVYVRDGALTLVFHVSDIEDLQDVLTGLNQQWSNVSVNRLIRSGDDRSPDNLVLVDQGRLTDRQMEVLETAHEMGYFDHPRNANASDVAKELEINPTTFTEHLTAAQRKVLSSILQK